MIKPNIIQFLSSLALSASLMFIPNLAEDLGASKTHIGIIVAAYAFATFMASYIFGRLSDVYSRRFFIKLGLGLSALTFFLQGLADPNFIVPILAEPWLLAIARTMAGFSLGIFPAALIVYVYDSTHLVGRFTSFGALGWSIGTFAAGLIAFYYGIFILSSACLFLAFAISFTLEPATSQRLNVPFFPTELMKRNWRVYISYMLRHVGANSIWVIYPLFIASLGADKFWIGVIYTVNTTTQFVVMQFIDRFEGKTLISVGLILSATTFLTFTFVQTFSHLVPLQVLLACSWSSLYIGSLLYLMKNNVERATSSGILGSVISLSQVFGALIGGVVSQFLGFTATMYVATAFTLAGFGLFITGNKGGDQHQL